MKKPASFSLAAVVAAVTIFTTSVQAELRLPALFSDNAVLQRDQPVKVWGWDDPGRKVAVTIAGQNAGGVAGKDGR